MFLFPAKKIIIGVLNWYMQELQYLAWAIEDYWP